MRTHEKATKAIKKNKTPRSSYIDQADDWEDMCDPMFNSRTDEEKFWLDVDERLSDDS